MDHIDCTVVGAGVVGLAVAECLARAGREVLVLEQHDLIGSETSSRNSEVIHAGIYYPSGSLKAALCVEGRKRLYEFCQQYAVPHSQCGKVIVASQEDQIPTVQGYVTQAQANGVDDLVWLSAAQVGALEPAVKAVAGVFSPSTGVIDSHAFMLALQGSLEAHGGVVAFNTRVAGVARDTGQVRVDCGEYAFTTDHLINSAGFGAPTIANDLGGRWQGFFAKGHYYAYTGKPPFTHLVYPVAEQGGLGVHVTLDLAGQVKFGPDVRWIEGLDYSFDERHFSDFVQAIRAYYPELDETRLYPSYTGIRPKLAPAGGGFQDFVISTRAEHGVDGVVHLLGIESPGLTSALAIAEHVKRALAL